jgi:hypothetical protein
LLAALSFTLITLGKLGLSAGFAAGFSAATATVAEVSVLGGSGLAFSFTEGVTTVLLLAGVTVAVLLGTVFLPQLFSSTVENTMHVTRIFFNIQEISGLKPKIMPMKSLQVSHIFKEREKIKIDVKSWFTVNFFFEKKSIRPSLQQRIFLNYFKM